MTDEQLIEAFESLIQTKSGYIYQDVLDLINRQKAEIERLQKYNTDIAFKHYNDGKSEAIKEFAKSLKEEFINNTSCGAYVRKIIDNLVKEMAEQKNIKE